VWVYDIARRTAAPLATERHNLSPVWTPDGRRLTYASGGDIFWRAADAGTAAELLLARDRAQYPTSWSADGRLLIFQDVQANADRYDLWVLPVDGKPRPLIATDNDESSARLSPDGRWLAYDSDESGRTDVYVRPFPNVNERKWVVSTNGGHHGVWSPDGRELFYAIGSALMRVAVDAKGDRFAAGTPESLFSGPFDLLTTHYTIAPDGNHFIMVEADPNARPTQIQVVLNWQEELKQRVPTR
jgi:hypothetical protein